MRMQRPTICSETNGYLNVHLTPSHEEKKWYVCKVPMTGYDGYAICYALHYSHAILLGCHKCNKNKRYVATSLCKSDNAMRRTSGKTSPVVGMPPRRCHT